MLQDDLAVWKDGALQKNTLHKRFHDRLEMHDISIEFNLAVHEIVGRIVPQTQHPDPGLVLAEETKIRVSRCRFQINPVFK